ncbi:MAG: LemA family protein [Candidatus Diapherotrites archaeon]
MNMKAIGIGIIAVLLLLGLIFALALIGIYNSLISLDQEVNAKWSEVENQYQRQADLIPNLVSIVSSAVKTETSYVKEVIEARTKWLNAKTTLEKEQAGFEMNQSMANFVSAIATAEAYPELQANKQFTALMDEVTGTQNRITTARGRYIESVQKFNTTIKQIPNNFIAPMLGFKEKEYYKTSQENLNTPKIGEGKLP